MSERKMGPVVQIIEVSGTVTPAWMEASGFNVWTTGHRQSHALHWVT